MRLNRRKFLKVAGVGAGTAAAGAGDLAVTIDYRDILSEILVKRLNNDQAGSIFPNFTPTMRGIVN